MIPGQRIWLCGHPNGRFVTPKCKGNGSTYRQVLGGSPDYSKASIVRVSASGDEQEIGTVNLGPSEHEFLYRGATYTYRKS